MANLLLHVVLVYRLSPKFPVYLSRGGIVSVYKIFPKSVKRIITKTVISAVLRKIYKILLPKNVFFKF